MADFGLASTVDLGNVMRKFNLAQTFVVPNSFDDMFLANSNHAVLSDERKCNSHDDGLVRIGYSAGTRTHNRDFAEAYPAIRRILRERTNARFVYFEEMLSMTDFPGLVERSAQVEIRPVVALRDLPGELCRFDINVVPLQRNNIFTASKSELKFFDSSLVRTPTIASPVGPFVPAIRHGETGFLAAKSGDWYNYLDMLVSNRTLRIMVGEAAYHSVLWRYSPERKARLLDLVFRSVLARKSRGGKPSPKDADRLAKVHAAEIARQPLGVPPIPPHRVVFRASLTELPDLTVVAVVESQQNSSRQTALYTAADLSKPAGTKIELIVVSGDKGMDNQHALNALIQNISMAATHIQVLPLASISSPSALFNLPMYRSAARFVLFTPPGSAIPPACVGKMLDALVTSLAAFAVPGPICGSGSNVGRDLFEIAKQGPVILRRAAWAAVAGQGDLWKEMKAREMVAIEV